MNFRKCKPDHLVLQLKPSRGSLSHLEWNPKFSLGSQRPMESGSFLPLWSCYHSPHHPKFAVIPPCHVISSLKVDLWPCCSLALQAFFCWLTCHARHNSGLRFGYTSETLPNRPSEVALSTSQTASIIFVLFILFYLMLSEIILFGYLFASGVSV